jgi:uncharacterized protein YukJ
MPVNNYGVLKGRPIDRRLGAGPRPHYQVLISDGQDLHRIAVNVKSALAPSELKYILIEDFQHPTLGDLQGLADGFQLLPARPGGLSLDFIRGNLFDPDDMRVLPGDVAGADNDLNELIDGHVQRAMADEQARVYAFGAKWGPETARDQYFGFTPGSGIHDIHMNQGNSGRFQKDNGVWQDGGLLFHDPTRRRFTGLFLAFQSQSFHTDDATGDPLVIDPQPTHTAVRILAALVNPAGDDPGREMVLLHNLSPQAVPLDGWRIADRNKRTTPLRNLTLEPHQVVRFPLPPEGAQLSNDGGIITLLDRNGLKVHGVSYTRSDTARQGWTIVF